jgi:hypothetical protein
MLFPSRFLEGIAGGTITLAFRRWKSPRAKVGSRHHSPVGLIEIDEVDVVELTDISVEDARNAGYESLDELVQWLSARDGPIHRVAFHFAGPDPRIELRNRSDLDEDEIDEIKARLAGFDRASEDGPWTAAVLGVIRDRPGVRAVDLAGGFGRETLPFKRDVRRLKELGLTESLEVGYRLSPRGRAFLATLPEA